MMIRRLLEEVDVCSDEPVDDNLDREDNLRGRNFSSDTEQVMSDIDFGDDMCEDDLDTYTGKGGEVLWLKRNQRLNARVRAHNVPNAVKGYVKKAKTNHRVFTTNKLQSEKKKLSIGLTSMSYL